MDSPRPFWTIQMQLSLISGPPIDSEYRLFLTLMRQVHIETDVTQLTTVPARASSNLLKTIGTLDKASGTFRPAR